MSAIPPEFEELRISIERLRALLDNLVVRGLRACGQDELTQLRSHADHLDQSGAGHLASVLTSLREQIEQDKPASAQTLLEAQTNVRLVERLLTLRVVKSQYANAVALLDNPEIAAMCGGPDDDDEEDEEG